MKKKNPKNKQTKFAIIWGENSKLIRGVPLKSPGKKQNKKKKTLPPCSVIPLNCYHICYALIGLLNFARCVTVIQY